jgi:hypothetical protein
MRSGLFSFGMRCVAVAVVALIAGCAATRTTQSAAPRAQPPLADGDGRIYFYRTTFHALSVQPEITVDGEVVGKAVPNAYFFVDRKAGSRVIATTTEPDRSVTLTLESAHTRYVRLDFSVSWFLQAHINPVRIDNAIAAEEIAGLHEIGR